MVPTLHTAGALARGKFQLTNQDSAGGKNSRKGIEITQLFSPEMALNIHKRGLQFQKPTSRLKAKNMNHFVFLSFYFGAKNGSPALDMATRLYFIEYRQVGL